MALKDEFISRLKGTFQNFFRINGIGLKNNSGTLEVRTPDDTAYANTNLHSIKILGSNASNGITITAPGALGSNVTLTLPNSDGASGEVLTTDGSGILSWSPTTANGSLTQTETFTQATSSPLTIFTPPTGAFISKVAIDVTSAASGGSPTLQVGTASDPNAYMDTDESDVKTVATYLTFPFTSVIGAPDAVVLTITPSAQTFSGRVFVEYTTPA